MPFTTTTRREIENSCSGDRGCEQAFKEAQSSTLKRTNAAYLDKLRMDSSDVKSTVSEPKPE